MRVIRALLQAVAALLLATSAHAQITYRSSASATSAGLVFIASGALSTNGTAGCNRTISPATPAGLANDLLVATVVSRDAGTLTPSAGWNTQFSQDQTGLRARLYWRIADGSGNDTLTVTKTVSCTDVMTGAMARFRGADTTTPFETGNVSAFLGTTTVGDTVNTLNSTVANTLALFTAYVSNNNSVNTPAGFNAVFNLGTTTGANAQVAMFYKNETAAGAEGPYSTTQAAAANNIGGFALIRPGPATLSINMPAGTADGDVMVASIAVRPCSITSGAACTLTVTAPAGWTLVGAQDQTTGGNVNANFGSRLLMYTRVASGDTGPYVWTVGGNPAHSGAAGGISTYQNVDNASPVITSASAATASAAAHVAPTVSSGVIPNSRLVTAYMVNSSGALSTPAGMTERFEVDTLPANNILGLTLSQDDEARAAAGATGTRSSTFSGPTTDTGATFSLLLRPADTNFEVLNGAFTVRCAATPMVVTVAARDPNWNVNTAYTGTINLSTSTGTGDWALLSGSGTFNNGAANDGAATYTYAAGDLGIVSFNLTNTTAVTLTVTVQDASTTLSNSGATTITFVTEGYNLTPDPLQIAGKPQTWTVDHRTAPGCGLTTTNGHGAANAVKLWLTLDGAHPGAAALPTATGTGAAVALPTAEPGANNINLDFSGPGALSAGQAPFTLTTTDVGKYVINIRDTNTTIRGTSSPVVVRPFALALPGVTHGNAATSTVLAAAGDNFSATVTAYNWAAADDANNDGVPDAGSNVTNNTVTPSFAWDVTMAPTANLAGVAGTLARGVACDVAPTVAQASFSAGSAAVTDWCYSEAGNVFLGLTAANYLNSPGVNVTGSSGLDGTGTGANGYVGRFKPKRFALTGAALTQRSGAACGVASTFTYMNEALNLAFTLSALNTQGAVTQNYTGTYAKFGLTTFANYQLGARSGTTNLTSRLDGSIAPTGTWSNGVANASVTSGIRRATPDAPDGPYTAIGFGINPVDSDSVAISGLDFDADNNAVNERKSLGVSAEARFGRLRLQSAVTSSRLPMALPIETQYWNGSQFVTNTADSCTTLARSSIALTFTASSPLQACETSVSTASVGFTLGVGALTLAAPGSSNNGNVIVSPQVGTASGSFCNGVGGAFSAATSANRSYLLGRWNDASNPDANASTDYDDNPAVRAAFGVYGAQPRNYIFHRENY